MQLFFCNKNSCSKPGGITWEGGDGEERALCGEAEACMGTKKGYLGYFLPIPGSCLLLQNPLFMYPPVISEVQWIMIHVNVGLSSRIWYQQLNLSQPSQQDPPPCPLPTCTSPKYKAWVHKFHLSFDFTSLWPFCFTQYFPGGLFSFSSWNYSGKTGKRSEVWIFWWGHLSSRELSSREFSERGFTRKKKDTNVCIEAPFLQEAEFLSIPIPLAFCLLWVMDPKGMVLLMDQECPCWISPLASH